MNHETQSKLNHETEQHYLEDIKKELVAIKEDVAILKNDVKPMLKWFDGMNVSRKLLMWILGLFASIGGLILMWREIFSNK